jgi:hypothetical protein
MRILFVICFIQTILLYTGGVYFYKLDQELTQEKITSEAFRNEIEGMYRTTHKHMNNAFICKRKQ